MKLADCSRKAAIIFYILLEKKITMPFYSAINGGSIGLLEGELRLILNQEKNQYICFIIYMQETNIIGACMDMNWRIVIYIMIFLATLVVGLAVTNALFHPQAGVNIT